MHLVPRVIVLTSLECNLPATALIQSSQASTIKTASVLVCAILKSVAAGLNVCANALPVLRKLIIEK